VPELHNIDVSAALQLASQSAFLLDVRECDEWEAGHSPLATHIPLAELPDHLAELPKDRVIVCICRSGGRSTRAGQFLVENDFEAVNLEGGLIAWASEGQTIVADSGEATIT
jgi:rhodanese-related sulfurtransferase